MYICVPNHYFLLERTFETSEDCGAPIWPKTRDQLQVNEPEILSGKGFVGGDNDFIVY